MTTWFSGDWKLGFESEPSWVGGDAPSDFGWLVEFVSLCDDGSEIWLTTTSVVRFRNGGAILQHLSLDFVNCEFSKRFPTLLTPKLVRESPDRDVFYAHAVGIDQSRPQDSTENVPQDTSVLMWKFGIENSWVSLLAKKRLPSTLRNPKMSKDGQWICGWRARLAMFDCLIEIVKMGPLDSDLAGQEFTVEVVTPIQLLHVDCQGNVVLFAIHDETLWCWKSTVLRLQTPVDLDLWDIAHHLFGETDSEVLMLTPIRSKPPQIEGANEYGLLSIDLLGRTMKLIGEYGRELGPLVRFDAAEDFMTLAPHANFLNSAESLCGFWDTRVKVDSHRVHRLPLRDNPKVFRLEAKIHRLDDKLLYVAAKAMVDRRLHLAEPSLPDELHDLLRRFASWASLE